MALWGAFALLLTANAAKISDAAKIYNVRDYGAVGDGVTKDTAAIVRAVGDIAGNNSASPGVGFDGGVLYFPSGRFLSAPFNLTSDMTLYLEAGATLLGSDDEADWPVIPALPSYGQGRDHPGPRRTSLVHGQNLSNVRITGANGTIDGQGAKWWAKHHSGEETITRGHLIELMWSDNVELTNLTLRNSPFWTVHPVYVRGFLARGLTILNPTDAKVAPNTDGIDPDSTQDVLIEDCYIATGDDAIAIKSGWDEFGYGYGVPSRNITIRRCSFSSPCCAAVCIGSEMSGGVEGVLVEDSELWASAEGLRLKSGAGRGGYIRNITMRNVVMRDNAKAFMYNCNYGGHPAGYNISILPDVGGIAARNVSGTGCGRVAELVGLPARPMYGIEFDDVRFDGGDYECSAASGTYAGMVPKPCDALAPASGSS
eukprot:g3353.t1